MIGHIAEPRLALTDRSLCLLAFGNVYDSPDEANGTPFAACTFEECATSRRDPTLDAIRMSNGAVLDVVRAWPL
jgi:hypothetical protein